MTIKKSTSGHKFPLIILFGPPGSGKGTQANLICKKLNILNLSIGDSVRNFISVFDQPDSPELERVIRLKTKMQLGELQDFADIKYIVENQIKNDVLNGRHVLIEGLPRTVEQASWLANFFTETELKCLFFHFKLPSELILHRLSHRYYAPGLDVPFPSMEEASKHCPPGTSPIRRLDDQNVDIIRHRLDVQYNSCKDEIISTINQCPTVNIFDIDARPDQETIFENLLTLISNHIPD